MVDFIFLFFDILQVGLIVLGFVCFYFIGLELFRRHRCKTGMHAGHIRDGKLICHTCFKEVDHK